MATVVTEGRAAAAPSLRRAMDAFLGDQLSAGDWLQWGHLATAAACMLWDCESWEMLSARHVELARASGALAPLFIALNGRGMFAAWSGDFEAAAALVAEEEAVKDVTGIQQASYGALLMAAYQGRAAEASALISASEADSADRGEGLGTQNAAMMKAILHNGLGHYAPPKSVRQTRDHLSKGPYGRVALSRSVPGTRVTGANLVIWRQAYCAP